MTLLVESSEALGSIPSTTCTRKAPGKWIQEYQKLKGHFQPTNQVGSQPRLQDTLSEIKRPGLRRWGERGEQETNVELNKNQ